MAGGAGQGVEDQTVCAATIERSKSPRNRKAPMDALRDSVFDRSGRVESDEARMMRVGREAAAAAVNRARWIRALRIDPAELLADAASEATAAILSAQRNAARRLPEGERQEVAAAAADEWIGA